MNKLLNKITQGNLEVVAANANATLKRSNSKVFVKDMEIKASIGLLEHERDIPQTLTISVDADINVESYGHVTNVSDTVNYYNFKFMAEEVAATGHITMLEIFADKLAAKCFAEPRIEKVTITLVKPAAMQDTDSSGFACTYSRS